MRYEDASHTGAFQGSQPVANDDLDSVPAGSRTPATGNLISGEGTQTGSAGADVAAGAHVAAIGGKGGEDTSFSGGKLSVSGEFGHLSVDKDGNYIYQANKGVENVRDRFTYTLADNNGATDTGALIVEIGKTPVVIKTNAQQIVPGPDGVVTLPPGVELSDIMVVGRNLVINMPDGTQLIIVDGAIFVPQLQLGGVEVPATNLAALLIGQEPQPAAGEAPQSSGGNFDVPVPPLDPGVPLGDLIPPTEYDYNPPEPEEVFDIVDREPSIQIQPDGQPASVAAVDSVDEDGLPTRDGDLLGEPEGSDEGADGNPSNNSDTDETTSGNIIFDSPDGVDSITINGVAVVSVGQVISGAYGTLTITSISDSQIGYSYTLDDNTSGDNTQDDFTVILTDEDGDTATATLTIDIIDDVPTARDDTDAVIKGETSTDGNVLTGVNTTSGSAGSDTSGADDLPNGVTGIHAGTSGAFASVTSGGVLVHGTFGDLLIHADGSYTYTANGQPGPGGNDVFTYQVTDGDGDTDTATLTINVPPDSIPVAVNAAALVDDDGLPLGNHDSAAGDDTQSPDPDGDESTFGGTVTANFGTDGPGTFTLGSDMDGKVVTIGQEEVTYHVVGNVLTAEVSDGARTGTDLFTVTLNADGTYSVQLLNNVLQVDDGTNTENNATASITFTAHDSDGDVGNGTLTITLDDDIPVAKPPIPPEEGGDPTPLVTGLVDEDDLPAGNGDNAPGDDDPGNADGDNDGTTAGGAAGSLGGLFNAGADAPLTFSLSNVTSGLPTLHSNGALVTYDVSGNVLTASANGSPVFTLTVNADGSWTFDLEGQLDHPTAGTEDNLSLDLSSVIVATDADGDSVGAAGGVFVVSVDDDSPTQSREQLSGIVDEDAVPGGIAGGPDDVPGEDAVATGSVATLFNSGADTPLTFGLLADTSGLPALTSAGETVTYEVVGNMLTASAGGNPVFTFVLNANGSYTFTLVAQLDHPALEGLPGDDVENDLLISLGSIIQATDADGDSVAASDDGLVITVDDDTPTAEDVEATQSSEDANVIVNIISSIAGGADGVDLADVTFSVHTGLGSLSYDGAGEFTYDPAPGEEGDVTFNYTIVDADGDEVTKQITIHLGEDSTPQVGTPENLEVDEDGFAFANDDNGQVNPTETDHGENLTDSGNVVVNFGDDVPANLATSIVLLDSPALDGQLVDLDGNPVTFALNGSGQLVGTANGVQVMIISITGAVAGPGAGDVTYSYSAQLLQPVQHADVGNTENSDLLSGVQFQVTDSDSDTAGGSFSVTVWDDVPSATNDVDTIAPGFFGTATGNVLTGSEVSVPEDTNATDGNADVVGADTPGAVTLIASNNVPANTDGVPDGSGNFVVNGQYGVLTINANGDYSYDRNDGSAGGVSDVFTYTLTDADGDSVTATLTINIGVNPPVATTASAAVDDDGLAGANAAGANDINANTFPNPDDLDGAASSEATFRGQLGVTGGDGDIDFNLIAPGGSVAVGQETVTFSYVAGLLTATIATSPDASRVGDPLFTVTLNEETGEYVVTLVDNVLHGDDANNDEDGSEVSVNIQYQVTDAGSNHSAAPGTLTIVFNDDVPTAAVGLTGQHVAIDESAGLQVDSNDVAGPLGQFAAVANKGVDPDMATQFAANATAIVNSTGTVLGADGGTVAFSLNVSSAGVDSGLDTTDGHNILLTLENGIVVGRVSGGADDGKAAFAISIDSTGHLSMVEWLSINHPDAANPDDVVSIANGTVLAVVTASDADGDVSTASTPIGSLIQFQDSGPILTAVDNMNIQNSGDVAHTAAFAFNLGADGANTSNDVITNVTGGATVGGVAVQNWILTPGAETATTASYSFSFDYPVGGGNTAHETGTLVFDKAAGTYTIDLANPIQGVTTILQTSQGTLFQGYEFGTSTPDGSQPAISVTQIQDLAGTANDIYVQFTSVAEPSSGTGDDNLEVTNWVPGGNNPAPINGGGDTAWNAGQLFNQTDSWVSTSNSANGVAGDTIQGGEVLDFSLVQGANPTGNLAQPGTFAQASAMFLKFDGIGAGEDMIVVLKLYDPNTNTYTTRAIMVENGDIQKGPGAGPGQFSGVTLDNNDGLVIIESNDYNLPGENWVIVGAQIAGSDEGITGTAINLNSAIGAAGDSVTGNAFDLDAAGFQSDTNDGPFKISSIGFLTTSTTPQNAQLDFNVTVTDGDGDSVTQAITATVTPAADSSTPISLGAAVTTISQAPLSTKSTAMVSDTQTTQVEKTAANSNTLTVAAAVAAAGVAEQAAAGPVHGSSDLHQSSERAEFGSHHAAARGADSVSDARSAVSNETQEAANDSAPAASSGHHSDQAKSDHALDDSSAHGDAKSNDAPVANDQGPAQVSADASPVAPTVAMVSAEALQAAGVAGNAQHGGSVEQIVAEALGHGNASATVDALLNALPGGNGAVGQLANLASPAANAVPGGDMSVHGGFATSHDMIMNMHVAMHHDAVQPVANG
jgi:T1SS-143 domain-containing protein